MSRVLLVWCALSWCTAAKAEVQTVAVPPAADSYIEEDVPSQDPKANENFGTATELRLRGGGRRRALLRFEGFEPTLLPGDFAQLISATVEISVVSQTWPTFAGGELSLHRVLEPWTELGVTWNCADDPFAGTFPSFPGCSPATWGGGNFDAGAADTFQLNFMISKVEIDVTSEIEAFLAGEPNDGWLVRLVDESTLARQVTMASGESEGAVPPSLTVIYEVSVDTTPPLVTLTDPIPGGFDIRGPRPELTFEVSDSGTGLDPDLLVELDAVDISAECAASPPAEPVAGSSDPGAANRERGTAAISLTAGTSVYVCVPPGDLAAGPHTLDISVSDLAGNTAALSGTFVTLLTPGPHVVDLEATADTTLLSDAVDKNRGKEATLEVQRQPARRALVEFDRAGLADLAGRTQLVIDGAMLELWVEATNSFPEPLTVAPFRLLERWEEIYATWSCAVEAPEGECSRPWSGGNLAATAESSVVVPSGTTGPISWTVTNDVATSLAPAVDPPFVLYGWALRFDPETTGSLVPPRLVLSSRDSETSPAPRLSVTFSIPDIDDFVPPGVVFLQPGATTTDPTPTVELSFDDGDSGVDPSTFAIEVGGVDFTTSCTVQATGAVCTSPALEVGDSTYTATLADLAGNVAVSVHEVELLAGAPPQIQITQPPPAVLNQEVVAIAASFSDADGDFDPASVRVILDGAHLTAGCAVDASQALCTSPLLAAGSHRLVVVARDLAGNESAAEHLFELTFDGTFPEIAIVAPATWFVLDERPDIEVTYSGTDLDTATFALRIDGVDSTAECDIGASSASCEPGTALAEGLHRVEAEIANTAGNVRTAFVDFDLLAGDGSYVRTLNAVADSSIGKTSRGLATTLEVSSSPVLNHGLVRFDTELFGPLAPWIQLDAIGLLLMVADQEGLPFEGRIFQVYGLDRDWNEVEATFDCPSDDDPGQPGTQCSEPWDGAVAGPALDTETIDPSNVTAEFDLTAPGLDPEGWLVLDAGAASPIPVRVGMAAREHGVLNPPQLIVDFTLTGTPDFEPPTLAVVAPVGVVINEPMPDVELTYSDLESGIDPSSLAVSVGGVDISSGCAETAPGQATCPVPFALTAGFHAVDAQVSDNAGNPAAAGVEFELVLDAAPPTILRVAPPEVVYNQPQPTIEVGYSDDSSVETATLEMDVDGIDLLPGCTVSATGAVCTPPALAAGPHTVRVYIEDRIGQPTEELFDFEIVDDTAGPTLAIMAPTGTIYNDTTPAVTVTFSDAPAGVDPATLVVEVDGGSITASCSVDLVAGTAVCESGELTAGPHTISVSLADLAGNPASANGGFDMVLDADAPSLDVTGPTGIVEGDPTPEIGLAFSDAVSGIDAGSLVVRVDGLDISSACVVAAGTAACEPPALGEGDHTVTAEIADLAGNVATDSQTFTVDLDLSDTAPPSLAITGPAGPVVDDPAPAITVTYSDAETDVDLTSLRIAVDGHELVTRDRCAVAGATATCIPPSLGSGTHALTAEIRDLAGNPALTSSSFDLSFTGSDTVDPLVDITEPASSPVFDDLTPQIRVEYSDADSGVAILTLAVDVDGIDLSAGCTVEDAFAVCEPPPLTVGSHLATATVEDLHGNVGTATLVFAIDLTTPDTTPPVIAIAEPSTTPLDVEVTPIRVTYADGETGIDLSSLAIVLDTVDLTATCDLGPTEATCTSPVMAEGAHLLETSVQDLAGNPASASFPFEVVLIQDPDPPAITWIEPIGVVLDDPTPTVTVDYADAISGVDTSTLRVWVDAFELTGCTVGAASATCEPPPLGNGEHIGRAEVRDLAGNLATVERSFFVQLDLADEDPPSVAVTSPSSPIVVDDPSPEIRVVYSDAESGVDLTSVLVLVDGIALVEECAVGAAEAVCEPPDLAQGPHEIEGGVADLAGNQATTTFAFEIQLTDPETDPPLLDILSPTGTVQDDTNPQILLQYSDAGSGVALSSLVVEVDGIPVTSGCQTDAASAVCPSPTLAAGPHQVDARISDLAGNEAADQSTFTIVLTGGDVTPPSVTVESPASVVTLETARFTVRYDDAESGVSLAGVSLSLDGVPLDSGCSIGLDRAFCDLVTLTEGPHTASASVPDLEGNTTTVDHPFTVDLTPPDTVPPNVAVLEPEVVVVDDPQPGIRVEYSDAGSGLDTGTVQVLLDGLDVTGGCTVGSAEATCTPAALGAGSHLVQASVEDLEGNLGSGSLSFELILTPPDLVAPAVTIVAPSAATVPEAVPVSLELTYSDDASGIDPTSLSVMVDGGDVSSSCQRNAAEAICPLGVLALGPHTVDVQIADGAGNPGTAAGGFEVVPETGPPVLDIVTPVEEVVRGDATPEILIEYSDAVSGVDIGTLAATLDDVDLLPGCVVDAASAVCEPQSLAPGFYRVVAQIADLRGNVATASLSFEVSLELEIAILAPESGHLTADDVIEISGTVSPEADSVTIEGVAAVLADGTFTAADVPLHEGSNTLTAIARTAGGGIGSATIGVVRDTTAPAVVIQAPDDGFVTTSSQILVTGEYNEPASSGSDVRVAAVTVNGVPAPVEQRTFALMNHLLQPGLNTIRVEATDAAGNVGSSEITVTLLTNPAQKIEELLGNGQSGIVGETLANPLLVRVTDGIGNPLPERLVEFEVTRGDGVVSSGGESGRSLSVRTDPLGRAQVDFTLGERSGMGNHEVTVTSAGFPGSLIFCASGEPMPGDRVVRVQGNVQTGTLVGVVGAELPKPLFAQVFDAMKNPVEGAEVTFEVVTGGGSFDGQPTETVETDARGVATAIFTLGPLPGVDVHVVKATIPQGSNPVASFNITGLEPGEESMTSVSGLVLDNQDDPVPLVTVSIADTALSAVTDAEGRFRIDGAPVGTIHLVADGRTTPLPGSWPVLEFEMVTVSGQDNDLGMPVRLLPMADGVLVGGAADVVIPLEGVPGASLTVYANSVTFPDGSREGLVSFTQVHNDKVPMVPPLGSVFAVALTIQPPGAHFDPPAQIQIPNPGHRPGEVVDIFSFDHDIGEFVPGGTGSVTPDGLYLRSNPGFGVRKGGWHGCAQPIPDTDACNPGSCTFCTTDGPQPDCEECEICTADGCETPTLEEITAVASIAGGGGGNLAAGSRVGSIAAPAAPEEDELIAGKGQPVTLSTRNLVGRCSGTLTYTWDPDDDTGEIDGQTVTHVYEDVGTYDAQVVVSCENCPEADSASDTVTIKVIRMDLRLFNLPEEDEPEPNEIDPGGVVALNNDDDDEDGMIDLMDSQVFGDDDLQVLRLDVDGSLDEGKVILDFEEGADKMKVWEDRAKMTEVELPKEWELENEDVPGIVWIEGVERSESEADITYLLRYENDDGGEVEDRVNVTVLEVDLDVDSDNNNGFDPPAGSPAEDEIEDVGNDPAVAGKYVFVNHDDDDQDTVTDFADGFNRDGTAGNDDDANPDERFVPLKLKLPSLIDVSEVTIRLTYDDSDPAAVTVVDVPQIPATITVPDYRKPGGAPPLSAGAIRLWTVEATGRTMATDVKSGGQFVPSGTYTASELGIGSDGMLDLWVEAVEVSGDIADQRILVEVDPDGESGPRDFMLQDAVRVTAVSLEVRDTAATPSLIEGGDMAFISAEPRMPQLTASVLPANLPGIAMVSCFMEFEYDRTTPAGDGRNCPTGPDLTRLPLAPVLQMMAPGATWNIAADIAALPPADSFFGGDGWVTCIVASNELRHEFRIRGRNPDDAAARAFIDANSGHWFAYAIGKHETLLGAELYNHFDLRRTVHGEDFLYLPILGFPNGWGLFQIDLDAPACLDKVQLWNWQANMRKGEEILDEKYQEADDWLNCEDPRLTSGGGCMTRRFGGCAANGAGHRFPHGQRPQSRISQYITGHPGSTTATVYGTNPHPCVLASAGHWLVGPPALPGAAMIPDEPDGNCLFSEANPLADGSHEDSVAMQCFNGCGIHHVTWNGGMWNFNPNINDYVHEVCQQVDP